MAVDYTGVFTRIGKLIKAIRNHGPTATTLQTDVDAAANQFDADGLDDIGSELRDAATELKDDISNWMDTLAKFADQQIADETLVASLGLPENPSQRDTLTRLIDQMHADAQTVKSNTATAGTPIADSDNHGNGMLHATILLDGHNEPASRANAHWRYRTDPAGSQLARNEVISFVCNGDAADNAANAGAETFSVFGGDATPDLGWAEPASGTLSGISTANNDNLLANGDFESSFGATSGPAGWTIESGTAGTNFLNETGAANIHRGAQALKITCNGTLAEYTLSQTMGTSLDPNRRYFLAFTYKANAAGGPGTLEAKLSGTGYTPLAGETISIASASLATTWTTVTAWPLAPRIINGDLTLTIRYHGTPPNGRIIYLDDVILAPARYRAGAGFAMTAGTIQFLVGDRFTTTLANDRAGRFQTFFGDHFGVQLPHAGSPTISDSLTT